MSDETHDIQDLDKKIKAASAASKPKEAGEVSKAASATLDFTAPILGGILIGYMIDNWLGTAPLFIIGLLLLGVGGGITNIYKASQNIGGGIGYSELHRRQKKAKTSPSSDSGESESDENNEF